MKNILIALICFVLAACGNKISLATQKGGLTITALVNNTFSPVSEKEYKIEGSLIISNTTNDNLPFSNKELYLVSPTIDTRTYKDSLASAVIDFTHVIIPANTTVEQKVYWVVESISNPGTKDIRLELRN